MGKKKSSARKDDEKDAKTINSEMSVEESNGDKDEKKNMVESKDTEQQTTSESKPEEVEQEEDDEVMSFAEMGLDDRILLALIELNWSEPTPIQETAIPLVLSGRDILAKARTGSGKTGAYALPLIQKILNIKKRNAFTVSNQSSSLVQTRALIITPSRELCAQATRNLGELAQFCMRDITMVDLSTTQMSFAAQRQCLLTRPDVVISTPAKILAHLKVRLECFLSLFYFVKTRKFFKTSIK